MPRCNWETRDGNYATLHPQPTRALDLLFQYCCAASAYNAKWTTDHNFRRLNLYFLFINEVKRIALWAARHSFLQLCTVPFYWFACVSNELHDSLPSKIGFYIIRFGKRCICTRASLSTDWNHLLKCTLPTLQILSISGRPESCGRTAQVDAETHF